ncbi:thioesterase II family protein [Streptomyces sp. NBC_00893]|uniref:thioesterase II family protein n=1 Tax=Streptomyces sp. NBC_00893 TaxID=2975862 RepID=UPI00225A5622|nr:alpha/beta fold hydrolase [Streptomyces sp. NBC_00893]MCX4849544.1 alpha/beta fold hydrolase [Streptomyces sp. NBC_00893]
MTVFVRPRRVADPVVRVVVIHHAGGSAAAYHPLTRHLPDDWELLLLDLPGRGKRHTEAPLEDMTKLAETAADAVAPWAAGPPLALFGHSLGALVAVETARTLEGRGLAPLWVGVSGRPAPGVPGGGALHPAMTDDHLMDRLRAMGGIPARIDEVPAFRDRFLSLVRADLRALVSYRPAPGRRPLAARLTAMSATSDPLAPLSELGAWERETTGELRQRIFPGGHFHFLDDAFARLGDVLVEEIRHVVGSTALLRPSRPRAEV